MELRAGLGERTNPTTGNARAVRIVLGHMRIAGRVRYLGVDVEDVLRPSEAIVI